MACKDCRTIIYYNNRRSSVTSLGRIRQPADATRMRCKCASGNGGGIFTRDDYTSYILLEIYKIASCSTTFRQSSLDCCVIL